ncbi:hypothetical protein ACQ4PT_018505 [Festuca glaucescens]
MALHSWFDAELCAPIHPFILMLMRAYGFDLLHFHPHSILYLNIFRWPCETVRHEPPSLPVFDYFFEVVLRPGKINNVFGSAIVRILPNKGNPPHPSLQNVKVEKTTSKEYEKNLKIMQSHCKRSVRDLLEEMIMAGGFKMKSYSRKHLGLRPSITPPELVMTYEEAKEREDKLIGPYTEDEHRACLADIGNFENYTIMAKSFKIRIPLRFDPSLGPQFRLPNGKSIGRRARNSHEPVGSGKRDEVGAMPRPEIVLAMKAKNSTVPCTKRPRKKEKHSGKRDEVGAMICLNLAKLRIEKSARRRLHCILLRRWRMIAWPFPKKRRGRMLAGRMRKPRRWLLYRVP